MCRTVLVVDDDSGVRDMLELVLKANNYVVRKAGALLKRLIFFGKRRLTLCCRT